jgi:peptidoglycan hydrolase-like protein with peptidoglycan-binding domain
MRNFIFLIIFSLLFVNLTSAQEVNTTSLKTNCINLTVSLKQGNRSSNVVVLQNFLREKGYLNAPATGFFGAQTLKAVKNFQKDNNINATGSIGPITRALINKLNCKKEDSTNNNIPNPTTPQVIVSVAPVIPEQPQTLPVVQPIEDVVLTAPNNSSLRVRTDSVLNVTSNSISVKGTVTAGARSGTEVWFELTTNPDVYKTSETKISNKVSQKINEKFEATFNNLISETNYYFRACAGNVSLGQRSCGGTITVKTN